MDIVGYISDLDSQLGLALGGYMMSRLLTIEGLILAVEISGLSKDRQAELLRLLANEIGEDELEMNVIGGNDDELDP